MRMDRNRASIYLIHRGDSKLFGHLLRKNIPIQFVLNLNCQKTIWPVHSDLYTLINDGWETVK